MEDKKIKYLLVGSFKVDPVTVRRPLGDHSLPGVENVRKHVDILDIPRMCEKM